ncbi:type II secretion system protein GspL [Ketobacter sp. MCCC 1A13808]|uniref:type II secretion system protein GspL n=1 Tax=Ketobacter sp. MCCC 1A13808 TaxID=2602738 RepID=UPI000F19AC5B|nr:type II secretion system protein GspL [Ketobacter sp. MCCC 1A13808]MVF10522.1 type II secretion system protein GspL [Ketobacter sp. MCCC 1A13808]RLP55952.1 MAG: type II secretion system protein GspL [Ketobacter sp.]
MTSKVFVRLVNESQWVTFLKEILPGEPMEVPVDLFVEWTSADLDASVSEPQVLPFADFVTHLHSEWPHSYQYGIDLIISGANVITTEVNIPSRQMRQIAQALPYMIEDQLAHDVSESHLVTGPRDAEGMLPVVAVPVSLLECLRQLFEQFDLPLDSVLPDMLCLPHREGEWTVLFEGRHLMIKRGSHAGLTIEMDAAPVVLGSIIENWGNKPEILRILFCMQNLNENVKNWIKTQIAAHVVGEEVEVQYEEVNSGDFMVICDHLHQTLGAKKPAYDLLQGRFASSGRRRPTSFKWQPIAALVGVFVVMYTAFLYTQSWQVNKEVARLDAETKTLYKRLFPRDKRVVNVRRQMEQHIKTFQNGSNGDSFMTLLALAGEQIHTTNRSKATLKPKRVAYDEGQGDLRLDLVVEDFTQLEQFKTRLQQASLAVETASATQDKEGVKARLKIRNERS